MQARIPIMMAALVAACLLQARTAIAEDVNCPPHRGETTIRGNVLVAAPCELDGTRVNGNVQMYAGGSLLARDVRVDGNLEAHTAFEVELVNARVRGNVELVELVGDESVIVDSRIDGDVLLRRNRSFLQIEDNELHDDLEALENTGGIHIFNNEVDGDLECRDNSPTPTGGRNDVDGDEEGQCRNLGEPDDGPLDSPTDAPTDTPAGSSADDSPSGDDAPSGDSGAEPGPDQPAFERQTTGSGGGSADGLTLLVACLLLLRRRRNCLATAGIERADRWRC